MTIRSKSKQSAVPASTPPAKKPKLTPEQRRAILAANAAKARAARTARSKVKQQASTATAASPAPKLDAKAAKGKPAPAPAVVATVEVGAAGSPDPFHLSPSWRIVAIDSRQWGLQTKAASTVDADAGDGADVADGESTGGWRTVAYSGRLDALCQIWAGRYARSRPGKLPAVLAEVIARLQSVQAELAAAMAAL